MSTPLYSNDPAKDSQWRRTVAFVLQRAGASIPDNGQRVAWEELPGGGRGLALMCLALHSRRPWVVVAPDDATARACFSDCRCFSCLPDDRMFYFPDNEVLPYDSEPAAASVVRARAVALQSMNALGQAPAVIVTTAAALVRRLAGPEHWIDSALKLSVGDQIERETLLEGLELLGYQSQPKVRYPGDYANHPTVLDIYTSGSLGCLRLRFDADRLFSIQVLQPDTQRTTEEALNHMTCLPAREVPIHKEAQQRLLAQWRKEFGPALSNATFKDIMSNLKSAPIERLLPLFVEQTAILLDWLPDDAGIYFLPRADQAIKDILIYARARFEELSPNTPYLLPPDRLWTLQEELEEKCLDRPIVEERRGGTALDFAPTGLTRQATLDDALSVLAPTFEKSNRLLLCVQTEARAESMLLMTEMLGRPAQELNSGATYILSDVEVGMVRADVDEGFHCPSLGITMLTEAEIFGQQIVQREEDIETATAFDVMTDFSMLELGDAIVHARHGVGRFQGLEVLDYGTPLQHLVIEYAESIKIFVRTEDLDSVCRYHGVEAAEAPLDAVNSTRWVSGLNEAFSHAKSTARQLLKLYAARAGRPGLPCDPPGQAYEKFCRSFPFVETRDQKAAISDVTADLTSQKPMDRIVSGDVGFGKTEVAMRAAFIAAYSGYQVVVMVPTTLLANQHFETFTKRFAEFPFRIELLSRSSQARAVLNDLKDGAVDLVIGTQRLLQSDVKLPRLGLLIIDEEHRFGVKDKERLTIMRDKANVLSMTATPIPRTLSMAMHGIRDISVIATPPAKRLSIRTLVADSSVDLIREAIQRELLRSGQVFYLHNSIASISKKADELRALLPEARIEYAHGRMSDFQLEEIMRRFHNHDFDVLVCTTIIEIGIDIPNANTMLIEDADHFGLAQLHQLRGRVGRSRRQAYCYLLKSEQFESGRGRQRLLAMERTTGLGEGLVLAHYDLEIRGAGELLGEAQAGDIQTIGFQLYMMILNRAIELVRSGEDEARLTDMSDMSFDLPMSGYLPDSYIENPAIRLSILSRLSRVSHPDDVQAILAELEDRFGPPPEEALELFAHAALRFPLRQAGVTRLRKLSESHYRLTLRSNAHDAQNYFHKLSLDAPEVFQEIDLFTYDITVKRQVTDVLQRVVRWLSNRESATLTLV